MTETQNEKGIIAYVVDAIEDKQQEPKPGDAIDFACYNCEHHK